MTNTKPSVTLDMSGLTCPAPLLGAKKVVDDLSPGDTLLLVSDCPGTADDLHAWAGFTGNEVVSSQPVEGKRIGYLIRKGGSARPTANAVLDVRGLSCPGPIIEAKKLLDGMQPGEVLLLISNCPGTPADIEAWTHSAARVELAGKHDSSRGTHEFYLRRK